MKYLLIILFSVFLFSCSVVKKNQVSNTDENGGYSDYSVKLTGEQERKFNYYFYEGTRFKAIGEANKSFMYFAQAFEIDSTCSACAYEISRLLLANENYDEAEKLMEKAVKNSPANRYYITLLSRLYQNNDQGNKAVKAAERLLDKEEPSVEDYYFVAQAQVENGLYEKAVLNLDEIENRTGVNEALTFEKYQIYIKNEDYKSAEKELTKLIDEYPSNSDYYIYLGDFYLEQNEYKNSIKQYDKAIDIDDDNGKVHFSLANYYINISDTAKFKHHLLKAFSSENIDFKSKFQRFMPFVSADDKHDNPLTRADIHEIFQILIDKHENESRMYGLYANFLVEEGKNDQALRLFDEALEIDASQPDIWQEFLFLVSSMEDNELLLKKASEAITFFPEEALFRLFHGVAFFQKDELQKAADAFNTGLSMVEENPGLKGRFHAFLGDIYYSLKKFDKCFTHYDAALKIDENNLIVLNNYSYYLSVMGKDLDRAERMSSRAVELDPGNATFLDTYAWILFRKGRFNEAKFIIERAVDNMDVPNGVIVEHYGDILFETGDVDQAVEKWKDALELDEHSSVLEEKIKKRKFIDE